MRYFAQGGGEVKPYGTDLWVFVNNPPHPFSIGDIVPDEWGIVSEYSELDEYLDCMLEWDNDLDF